MIESAVQFEFQAFVRFESLGYDLTPYDGGDGAALYKDKYTETAWRSWLSARKFYGDAANSGNDPEIGPVLEFANVNELAFYDYAAQQHCQATNDILDGKYAGAGSNNEPWASTRKRLLNLVGRKSEDVSVWVIPDGKGGGQFSWTPQDERFWTKLTGGK